MRQVVVVILPSLVLGLVGLIAFAYSHANPATCGMVNPFKGCGYSYDPAMIGLDYLFWFGIALAGVMVISGLWNHQASTAGS